MMNVPGFQDSLWTNGPSPGSFYNFPGNQNKSKTAEDFSPIKRTQYPTTTGTSVLGLKYDCGVLLAADTLGSYGSLARFRKVSRLMSVCNNTVVGGSGDYADFQYIQSLLERKVIDDACLNDGHGYTPKSIFSWLTREMYHSQFFAMHLRKTPGCLVLKLEKWLRAVYEFCFTEMPDP
ncbi:Proteasome subunit beta type-4 [Acropora cervicornis]|uniref:Proteasome subunit beta type-4 n=1 Tax=Acropora cervicornis TaxID=6130 RepID=A0AAD9QDW6_ACRCE|nr:Proteasome subunit beta type-4 [Acropora cervicornis]